jgi:hypothetical protein
MEGSQQDLPAGGPGTSAPSPAADWRLWLPSLHGLPLIPCGAGAEAKAPINPSTGGLATEWQKSAYTPEQIAAMSGVVSCCGTRCGPDAGGLLVFDLDGASAVERCRENGCDPATTTTWQVHRNTAPDRLKVAFRVPQQLWAQIPGKKKLVTKAAAAGGKTEQIELFWSAGQVIVLGHHRETSGFYFWPVGRTPQELSNIPAEWWALAQQIIAGPQQQHQQPIPPAPTGHPSIGTAAASDDLTRARAALRVLDPDMHHDDWVVIGMCLQSIDPTGGLDVWDEWSRTGTKYDGFKTLESKWRSFDPNGGAGAGTLFKRAIAAGWVDTSRPKAAPATPPLDGDPFIPADESPAAAAQHHDYVGELDDEARQELLEEIRSFRERLATRVSLDQVFPPGIASAVITYAAQQGLAPEGFILPILCAAASIMGNRVRATPIPGDDWTEPSILWGINIAVAGGGKTPISRASIEKPLLPWQIREREKHAEALRRWKHDRAQAERDAKAAASESGGNDHDPLEEFLAENPQPARRHLVINDATFEKLEIILENGSTPGLLAYHDEMGQWFSQLCRNPQASDRTKWLSLYPGSSIVTDRVGRDDVLVPHPAVSLMGNLQPARMQGIWAADAKANDGQPDGDGLWSRFLMQPLPDWDYTFGAQPAQLWPALANLYEQIDAAVPPVREEGKTPHCTVHISDEALPLFGTWVNDVRDERKARTNDEDRQYLAKGRGSTLRIALVLHAITQASCGMPLANPMSLKTIRGAVLLSLHYMTQRDQVMASLNPNHPAAAVKRLLARGSAWRQANGSAPVPLAQIRQWALPKRSCSSAERRGWLQQIVENTPGCGQIVESRKSIAWLPPAD